MRLLSLCSGIGAIDLAAEMAGLEIAGQVEYDPFCQQVLAKHWPNVKRMSDIKDVVGDEFGTIDVVAGGIPCFVAGTMILTKQGYIPIETVVVGDEVLTHLGRWRKVTSVMVRDNARLRRVKAQGVPDVITTDEHPFYTRKQSPKWNNTIRQYERTYGDPEWVEAQDLNKQCYVGQVLPTEIVDDKHSIDFWWLVGRYLADGWRVKRPQRNMGGWINIACAHHEVEEVKQRIQAAGHTFIISPEKSVTKIRIAQVGLYNYLEQFGRYAHGKKIPGFVFQLPPEKIQALIEGYFSGDGYHDKANNDWRATTVSKSLALSFALLAQRAYGVVSSVRKCIVKPTTTIEGRTVNQRDFWIVSIPSRNRSGFVEENYAWKLVRASEPAGIGTVYNISVQEDESYVADGAVVHNCQPFSRAGKRKGTEDDRHLWPYAFAIIKKCQPTWVLIENVDDFINVAFPMVKADLEGEGYEVQAFLLPAAAVEAPHYRTRCFVVAYSHRNRQRQWTHQQERPQECQAAPDACVHGKKRALAAIMEDSAGRRKWQHSSTRGTQGAQYHALQPSTGTTQPRMGRNAHGAASRLDRHQWPALPGEQQYSYEPARTIPTRSATFRSKRLKALGNAVVPQQIYPFFQYMIEAQAQA